MLAIVLTVLAVTIPAATAGFKEERIRGKWRYVIVDNADGSRSIHVYERDTENHIWIYVKTIFIPPCTGADGKALISLQ